MNVRRATPLDLPEIIVLERNTPSAAHWSESQYASILSDAATRLCLVVADDGGLQAFLVAKTLSTEWDLENIVVAEESRQRGLGSALMAALIAEARSRRAQAIFLEVRASNAAARRLYEKSGFVETGRRKEYYSNPPENAIVYALRLS